MTLPCKALFIPNFKTSEIFSRESVKDMYYRRGNYSGIDTVYPGTPSIYLTGRDALVLIGGRGNVISWVNNIADSMLLTCPNNRVFVVFSNREKGKIDKVKTVARGFASRLRHRTGHSLRHLQRTVRDARQDGRAEGSAMMAISVFLTSFRGQVEWAQTYSGPRQPLSILHESKGEFGLGDAIGIDSRTMIDF